MTICKLVVVVHVHACVVHAVHVTHEFMNEHMHAFGTWSAMCVGALRDSMGRIVDARACVQA